MKTNKNNWHNLCQKEISDIIHLIKNKWYNSDIIDMIEIVDRKKNWYNSCQKK